MIEKDQLACMIDHTLLRADAREPDIIRLCEEAVKYKFAAVCVNSYFIKLASKILMCTDQKKCTVVGFPLGASVTKAKVSEAVKALELGADEIDMVICIPALKDRNIVYLEKDIAKVVRAIDKAALLKVIIETCYLTEEEKIIACEISKKAGADFVKTSTGFGTGGARVEDVELMRMAVGKEMGIKASGGIKTLDTALEMINAGASRLGTSSGINILAEYDERSK
jgi:deoxyribose-phosphate aldolase